MGKEFFHQPRLGLEQLWILEIPGTWVLNSGMIEEVSLVIKEENLIRKEYSLGDVMGDE